jgi:hypothetical protein
MKIVRDAPDIPSASCKDPKNESIRRGNLLYLFHGDEADLVRGLDLRVATCERRRPSSRLPTPIWHRGSPGGQVELAPGIEEFMRAEGRQAGCPHPASAHGQEGRCIVGSRHLRAVGDQGRQVTLVERLAVAPLDRPNEGDPLGDRLAVGTDQVDLRVVGPSPVAADDLRAAGELDAR